ncbi:15344_t:CDS:2 [Funneliformis geosporum]|uniref:15344_t:CDS:1 n=1 Tax=Funneliformis geosporum TaxID=1117311 RepID=A0A9W4WXU4_9GLOM|nr:15344_t:CDS:2 [Funneliformis geosporum]
MSHNNWMNFANKTDALLSSCYIIKAAEKFIPIHHSSQHARDLRPKTLKKVY